MIKKKRKKLYSDGGWLYTPYKDSLNETLGYVKTGLSLTGGAMLSIAGYQGKKEASKIIAGNGLKSYSQADYENIAPNLKGGTWTTNEDGTYSWSKKQDGGFLNSYAGGGTMNKIGSAISGSTGVLDAFTKNAGINEGALSSAKSNIASVANNKVTSNSFDSLLMDLSKARNAFTGYTYKDFKQSTGSLVMNTINGGLSGASAGSSFGPWGAAIGAVVGLGAGIAGWFTGNSKAQKQADTANKVARAANIVQSARFANLADKLRKQQARSYARSFVADGGELNFGQYLNDGNYAMGGLIGNTGGAIDYANQLEYLNNYRLNALNKQNILSSVLQPYINELKLQSTFGFGGNLGTNGSDFTDGLTYFNVPTRHETNPNGGIPLGIAPDGQPNLVEGKEEDKKGDGGEIKWNELEYIFSDRLKPTQALIEKWHLSKNFLEYTYADCVRKSPVIKEAEERPNDPKSLETMDKFLADVAEDLENQKKEKEAQEMQEQLAQMSPEELAALGAQLQLQELPLEIIDLPTDYDLLELGALLEYTDLQAVQLLVAQQEGMVQPMMNANGGVLATGGDLAQEELALNMEALPLQMNPFTGAVPQETSSMLMPELEMPQLLMPTEEVPLQEVEEPAEEEPKKAEEMSTKELNLAIEDIIQYAKLNKDKQLLREAKKIKKASREDKEEFVDETLEEIREELAEQQAEEEKLALEQAALQEPMLLEVPLEQMPLLEMPMQEEMPQEAAPMMMAEGGELPLEEMALNAEQVPQEALEQPQQVELTEQSEQPTELTLDSPNPIMELLNLGESMGMQNDGTYTEAEVRKLRKKAEELSIALDILLQDDKAIADILNQSIQEQELAKASQEQPQLEEIPQLGNTFSGGGNAETVLGKKVLKGLKHLKPIELFLLEQGLMEDENGNIIPIIPMSKVEDINASNVKEEGFIPSTSDDDLQVPYGINPIIVKDRPKRINSLDGLVINLPDTTNIFLHTKFNNDLKKDTSKSLTREEIELVVKDKLEAAQREAILLGKDNNSLLNPYTRRFATGGSMSLNNPEQHVYSGDEDITAEAIRKWVDEQNKELGFSNAIYGYLYDNNAAFKKYYDTYHSVPETLNSRMSYLMAYSNLSEDILNMYISGDINRLEELNKLREVKHLFSSLTELNDFDQDAKLLIKDYKAANIGKNSKVKAAQEKVEEDKAKLYDLNNDPDYLEAKKYAETFGTKEEQNERLKKAQKDLADLKKPKVEKEKTVVEEAAVEKTEKPLSRLETLEKQLKERLQQEALKSKSLERASKVLDKYYKAKGVDPRKLDEYGLKLYLMDLQRLVANGEDNIEKDFNSYIISDPTFTNTLAFNDAGLTAYYTGDTKEGNLGWEKLNINEDGTASLGDLNPKYLIAPNITVKDGGYSADGLLFSTENNYLLASHLKDKGIYDVSEATPLYSTIYNNNDELRDDYRTALTDYYKSLGWKDTKDYAHKSLNGKQFKAFVSSLENMASDGTEAGNQRAAKAKELARLIKANVADFDNIGDEDTEIAESDGYKKASKKYKYNGQKDEVTYGKNNSGKDSQTDSWWGLEHFPYLEAATPLSTSRTGKRVGYLDENGKYIPILLDNYDFANGKVHGNDQKLGNISLTDYLVENPYDRDILNLKNGLSVIIPKGTDLSKFKKLDTPTYQDEKAPGVKGTSTYYELLREGPSQKDPKNYSGIFNDALRMAPLLNRPFLEDYSSLGYIDAALNNLKWAAAPRHGEYLKYQPVDTLYRLNQIVMDNNAARRGIMNAANGNTGMLMANMALQNSKAQQAMGENLINSETENWNRKKDVIALHNDVDKTYDLLALDADKANMNNNSLLMSAAEKQALLAYDILKGNNASLSADLSDKLNMLHRMGTENKQWKDFYDFKERMGAKNGGELVIKRKKKIKRYS